MLRRLAISPKGLVAYLSRIQRGVHLCRIQLQQVAEALQENEIKMLLCTYSTKRYVSLTLLVVWCVVPVCWYAISLFSVNISSEHHKIN